jgi:hypothetical protein
VNLKLYRSPSAITDPAAAPLNLAVIVSIAAAMGTLMILERQLQSFEQDVDASRTGARGQ